MHVVGRLSLVAFTYEVVLEEYFLAEKTEATFSGRLSFKTN